MTANRRALGSRCGRLFAEIVFCEPLNVRPTDQEPILIETLVDRGDHLGAAVRRAPCGACPIAARQCRCRAEAPSHHAPALSLDEVDDAPGPSRRQVVVSTAEPFRRIGRDLSGARTTGQRHACAHGRGGEPVRIDTRLRPKALNFLDDLVVLGI